MLNFIVLGLVPGTHFQITFAGLITFVLVFTAIAITFVDTKLLHHLQLAKAQSELPITHPRLAQLIQRISVVLQVQIARVKSNLVRWRVG